MSVGLKIYNPDDGKLVFDSSTDTMAGGLTIYTTGKSSGTLTKTPPTGLHGGWIVPDSLVPIPPTSQRTFRPTFRIISDTQVSWSFNVDDSQNLSTEFYWVTW